MPRCTGCGKAKDKDLKLKPHPLLFAPICEDCLFNYHNGEFTQVRTIANELDAIDTEKWNEIYCRWCGEGEGSLCLCDTCPKAFCAGCLSRNFGNAESQRILNMSDRWSCIVCSPQPLLDLCAINNWNYHGKSTSVASSGGGSKKRAGGAQYICEDVSRGREKFEIPVVNEVDNAAAPLDFVYVTSHVAGENVVLSNFGWFHPTAKECCLSDSVNLPHKELRCCSCKDNCRDATKCECILRMGGPAYNLRGILVEDRARDIYECNQRCSCNIKRCKNRVVGLGPRLRLEVFRCRNPAKGWGVRCTTDILPGTYVADYIGEIMNEDEVENRGLGWGDDYLFNLDNMQRCNASKKITAMEFTEKRASLPKELNMNVFALTKNDILNADLALQPGFLDFLEEKGVLSRALEMGAKLRNDPIHALKRLDNIYFAKSEEQVVVVDETKPQGISKEKGTASKGGKNKGESHRKGDSHNASANITTTTTSSSSSSSSSTTASTSQTRPVRNESWSELHQRAKKKIRRQAVSVLTDRFILEEEEESNTFVVDAKWFGSVGRFLNHSCQPNLDKVVVYCETQDIRMPRLAFFASEFIPAKTELCYDYGYHAGYVEGKSRQCLCGAEHCRKNWY